MRPRSAISCRCWSRLVSTVSAVAPGTALERGVEPMRLQSVLYPYPRHCHVGDRQRRTQLACSNVSIRRPACALASNPESARPTSAQLARALPGMATEQPRQPLLPKPLAPAGDKRIVTARLVQRIRVSWYRLSPMAGANCISSYGSITHPPPRTYRNPSCTP
jgi:hypothetical protein